MTWFDDFLEALKIGLTDLAEQHWRAYREEIVHDGRAFAESLRLDLERWAQLARDGSLTPEDFAWLVQGKRDLAEMTALRASGLTQARLDRLRAGLVDTVIGTALRVI
jgi:hypothetical protein